MVHMQYGGAATPPNTRAVVNMKDTFLICGQHNSISSVHNNIGNIHFLETHNFHLLEMQT